MNNQRRFFMLRLIHYLPRHVTGVHAFDKVNDTEYESALDELFGSMVKSHSKINFLLVHEADINNFSPGNWCGNIKLGLKYFFRWNKVVVVSDRKEVRGFSDLFKYILPGKFKSFPLDELHQAVRWVTEPE
jgi:hypothetical protein